MDLEQNSMKALVISWSDLSKDARVSRQIGALSKIFEVDTLACGDSRVATGRALVVSGRPATGLKRVFRRLLLLTRQFEKYYWSNPIVREAQNSNLGPEYKLIVANDIDALPFAIKLGTQYKAPVLFDAHEFSPAEFEEKLLFRWFVKPYKHYLCAAYIPKSRSMITVSPGLASRYKSDYGATAEIVYNAPPYSPRHFNPESEASRLHRDSIRLVHHGASDPVRKLDVIVQGVVDAGERFSLDLYLMPTDLKYMGALGEFARRCERIKIHPPIPMKEIVATISKYDMGIFVYPASSFNQRYCLPNKFFDFIQARLPVLVGPLPDVQSVTNKYNLGWVTTGYTSESIASSLARITLDQVKEKSTALDIAASEMCFDQSESVLMDVLRGMFDDK